MSPMSEDSLTDYNHGKLRIISEPDLCSYHEGPNLMLTPHSYSNL
jgi:hypothetical protein